jgi:nicotinamidase-related amidase
MKFLTRRQRLACQNGYRVWETLEEERELEPARTALIVVDMWDKHWSSTFTERVKALAPLVEAGIGRAREAGILILHAPSACEDYYAETPARRRFIEETQGLEPFPVDKSLAAPEYPRLPIDDTDGGSESESGDLRVNLSVWTKINDAIHIDPRLDYLSGDQGDMMAALFRKKGIKTLIYSGVCTNMCILNRSFGIKAMLRRGFEPLLARNLVRPIYNPARPPYISYDEAHELMNSFIEKFYCPSIYM